MIRAIGTKSLNDLAHTGLVPGFFIWMDSLAAKIYFFVTYGISTAQLLGVLFMACNRFTAYMKPMEHKQVFNLFLHLFVKIFYLVI